MSSKRVGLSFFTELGEAARLHLEHAGGLAAGDQLVGLGIVERDVLVPDDLGSGPAAPPVDHLRRASSMTVSVFKPEEVELHQAGLLDLVLGELGDQKSSPCGR